MPSEAEPNKNRKSPAAEPVSSLTVQYDRWLWALNNHDALQREADCHDLELKAWNRILRSDVLFGEFASHWIQ